MDTITQNITKQAALDELPVVVVGSGPVGVRFVQELHQISPQTNIILYGNEPWQPYNRVLLSSFLAGESSWESLSVGLEVPDVPQIKQVMNCSVLQIDTENKTILDANHHTQAYAKLVLATGSKPRMPNIQGVGQANVFVFRNMSDVQQLFARRTRSQHTVILGGGLLGLEAARAMQKFNTKVTVLEHNARLMLHQLNDAASAMVRAHIESTGIQVMTNQRAKSLHGEGRVTGVGLFDGTKIDCDTVIIAAGVNPNTSLALDAHLNIGRGIRVDDAMQTSVEDVYAIGECAEHRDKTYGIVAPGLEQAAVAAHTMIGEQVNYVGSLMATRLKVLDLPVFSMGRVTESDGLTQAKRVQYHDVENNIYRLAVVERNHLVGCIAIGDCPELPRLQEAITAKRTIYPWQLWRFKQEGQIWPEAEAASVVDWPATTIVCNCNNVSRGDLGAAIASGCNTVECLAKQTRASTVCGSCKPLLADLVGQEVKLEPTSGRQGLLVGLTAAAILLLIMLFLPNIPYATSVAHDWHWDVLWRDTFNKQVSGFVILALTALGLFITFRKRVKKVTVGDFSIWRVAHVLLGMAALTTLYVHTGGRLGSNLNFLLMMSFCGLAIAGAVSAYVIAQEHKLNPGFVKKWRANSLWIHILLFWPVPVLLAFHILKSYYF